MSNLQGWNYMEEQLHRYYMEEYMKNKCQFEGCQSEADYFVTIKNSEPMSFGITKKLCAKHTDEEHKKYRGRYSQKLIKAKIIWV